MFKHVKRLFRRLKKQHEFSKRRRQSDYRATALAVKLVLTGALTTSRRGVSIIARAR